MGLGGVTGEVARPCQVRDRHALETEREHPRAFARVVLMHVSVVRRHLLYVRRAPIMNNYFGEEGLHDLGGAFGHDSRVADSAAVVDQHLRVRCSFQ